MVIAIFSKPFEAQGQKSRAKHEENTGRSYSGEFDHIEVALLFT